MGSIFEKCKIRSTSELLTLVMDLSEAVIDRDKFFSVKRGYFKEVNYFYVSNVKKNYYFAFLFFWGGGFSYGQNICRGLEKLMALSMTASERPAAKVKTPILKKVDLTYIQLK